VCSEDDDATNKKDYLALFLQVWPMLERLKLALAKVQKKIERERDLTVFSTLNCRLCYQIFSILFKAAIVHTILPFFTNHPISLLDFNR
jgi:hypothetical protein